MSDPGSVGTPTAQDYRDAAALCLMAADPSNPDDALACYRARLLTHAAGLQDERDCWFKTAAEMSNNCEFYRGLITQIGDGFGVIARTSNDGSIQDSVLALKVPELVSELRAQVAALLGELSTIDERLARRPALKEQKTRADKVEHACYTAGHEQDRANRLERQVATLEQLLGELKQWQVEANQRQTLDWNRIEAAERQLAEARVKIQRCEGTEVHPQLSWHGHEWRISTCMAHRKEAERQIASVREWAMKSCSTGATRRVLALLDAPSQADTQAPEGRTPEITGE